MAEAVYNVQVTYKGTPDPELDDFIEETAEGSGGNWLGQGYDLKRGIRDHSWDFMTRGDAETFSRRLKAVRGIKASKPRRVREQDFRPEVKSPKKTKKGRR